MFETVVIATDGSESAQRCVQAAVDLAARFNATVHALYVVDTAEIESSSAEIRDERQSAIETAGENALAFTEQEVDGTLALKTTVQEGEPAEEIITYAEEVTADAIAVGTRGRHGEHAFLLGSVAEAVVRSASQPVLTVRQLEDPEAA